MSFPTKILLATDGSGDVAPAVRKAIEMTDESNGSELHVVHVVPAVRPHAPVSNEAEKRMAVENAERLLAEQTEKIEEAGGNVASVHLGDGDPAVEIVSYGEALGADLIVMGSRGLGGLKRALMGSVSDSVVRHAHGPVLVVRGRGPEDGAA